MTIRMNNLQLQAIWVTLTKQKANKQTRLVKETRDKRDYVVLFYLYPIRINKQTKPQGNLIYVRGSQDSGYLCKWFLVCR